MKVFTLRLFRLGTLGFLGIVVLSSCQTKLRPYRDHPQLQGRIDRICSQSEGTHFIVEAQKVYFKSIQSGASVPLTHYKTRLPDGYYFCTGVKANSSILE